jgi:hypothetical protein
MCMDEIFLSAVQVIDNLLFASMCWPEANAFLVSLFLLFFEVVAWQNSVSFSVATVVWPTEVVTIIRVRCTIQSTRR